MRKKGVTILEIMVALSLLSLTLMFVLNLVPGSILGLKISEKRSSARELARERLAQEMADAYPENNGQKELAPADLNDTHFRIWRTVSDGGNGDTKRISIRVTWAEKGKVGEVRQETVRAFAGE